MTDAPAVVADADETPVLTKRQMLAALEPLKMDDAIIIAVFPPTDPDATPGGFSETENASDPAPAPEDGEDDSNYLECTAYDSEIVTSTDPQTPDKKALLLYVDMDSELDDNEEEDGDDADDKSA